MALSYYSLTGLIGKKVAMLPKICYAVFSHLTSHCS